MLTMVVTMECSILDSCDKSFDSLTENSLFHPEDPLQLEQMYQFWNESPTMFLSTTDEKREFCSSSWPTSDNCCCIGRYDPYDADYSLNQANDYAYCIMGYHKTLSPLLKDSFLTTPFLEARKAAVSFLEDGDKVDDTKNRENLLEEMASADLTTYCVDPNEIFYSGRLNKLGSVVSESQNTTVGSTVVSDFCSVVCSGDMSYEDIWSDSDSEELPSSSQPSEEEIDEIDVVSVTRPKDSVQESSVLQFSSYESCILPATPLMSERVAALHNYSTRPAPCSRVAAQRVNSAPHSPSDRAVPTVAKRSMSTPSSPAARPMTGRRKRRGAGAAERQKNRSKRFKSDVDHNKRALHNKLEQTRRLMLMEQFHQLRDVIPTIKDNARVSKSDILTNGRSHIQKLQQAATDLEITHKKELKIREKLERSLDALKASSCRRSSAK